MNDDDAAHGAKVMQEVADQMVEAMKKVLLAIADQSGLKDSRKFGAIAVAIGQIYNGFLETVTDEKEPPDKEEGVLSLLLGIHEIYVAPEIAKLAKWRQEQEEA